MQHLSSFTEVGLIWAHLPFRKGNVHNFTQFFLVLWFCLWALYPMLKHSHYVLTAFDPVELVYGHSHHWLSPYYSLLFIAYQIQGFHIRGANTFLRNLQPIDFSFQPSILSGHMVNLMIFIQKSVTKKLSWIDLSWSLWLIPGRLWWKILCWVSEVMQRNAYVSMLQKYHLHSSSKLFWKCHPSEEFMPEPITVIVMKSGKMTQMARKKS